MIDPNRAALSKAIADLCDRYPHWRFGQIVANVAGWADVDVWDVEDQQLLDSAMLHLQTKRGETRTEVNDSASMATK